MDGNLREELATKNRMKAFRNRQKAEKNLDQERGKKSTAKEMLRSAFVSALSVFSETKQAESSVLIDTPLPLPKCQQFFNLNFLPVAA